MDPLRPHWTDATTDDFVYRIGADFVQQIENALERSGGNQAKLAETLHVTPARVSQVLNSPGNMKMETVVEYARAVGLKVAIVAYDDNDPDNINGPVNAQVIAKCWERAGRPRDFFDVQDADHFHTYVIQPLAGFGGVPVAPTQSATNSSATSYAVDDTADTDASKTRISKEVGATTNG